MAFLKGLICIFSPNSLPLELHPPRGRPCPKFPTPVSADTSLSPPNYTEDTGTVLPSGK